MLKMGKRLFLTLAIFCGLFALASCNTANAMRIRLDSENYEVSVGETVDVSAEVTKDGVATSINLGYKSFDESIATFVGGKLTGVSEGTTQIKVYSLDNPLYDAVATVTVSFAQSLQADFSFSDTMYKGDTQKVKYTLALDSQDALVSFRSSDDSILSVDSEGNVLGLGYGTAEVIAKVAYANDISQYREFALQITVEGAKYSITYDLAGGVCNAELPDSYIEGIGTKLPTPTKRSHNFLGWFDGNKYVTEITTTSTGNYDLVAHWEKFDLYSKLTLNLDGGVSENLPTEYLEGVELELPVPTKRSYNFLGWFNGETKVEKITADMIGDLELTARWEKFDLYSKLSFDLAGGVSESLPTEYLEGVELELPTPFKENYNFLGWFNGETKVEKITTDMTGDLSLVAQWEVREAQTLVVNPADESAYASIEAALAAAHKGDTILVVAGTYQTTEITKSVTLKGANHGTNPVKQELGAETVFTGDLIVSADDVTIDGVALTGNGRIKGNSNGTKNTTVTNVHIYETTIGTGSNASLYFWTSTANAVYENLTVSNVKFEKPSSSRAMAFYGAQIVNFTFVDSHYVSERSLSNDGIKLPNDTAFSLKGNVNISGNHFENFMQYTLWLREFGAGTYNITNNEFVNCGATWDNTYQNGAVTFNTYVGASEEKVVINVQYNTFDNAMGSFGIDNVSNASDDNFDVNVNYNKMLNSTASQFVLNKSANFTVDATYNYYDIEVSAANFNNAAWNPYFVNEEDVPAFGEALTTYKLSFDLDGGVCEELPELYIKGVSIALPTPTKAGYEFLGWYNGEVKVSEITPSTVGDLALVAKWNKATVISKLVFDLDGGLCENLPSEYTEGVELPLPTPTKEGFTFVGWYIGEEKVEKISDSKTGDLTIVAKWEVEVATDTILEVGVGKQYSTLDDAIKAAPDGAKIVLDAGEYTLGVVINKSLEIIGPNADLDLNAQLDQEAVINVTKDVAGNLAAKNIVFNGVHLKGTGGGGGITGVYFQDGGNMESLTFKSCVISDMNTFIKFVGGSSSLDLLIEDCEIHSIGQFIMWTTTSTNKIVLRDSSVDGSTCGAITNSAAALFRIRFGSLEAYNNYFNGDSANTPGYFECSSLDSVVKYNTFNNVTRFVHPTATNKVVFDENLYLDSNGNALESAPSTLTGTGVTADSTVAKSAQDVSNLYMKYLISVAPERYFLITFDTTSGEIVSMYPYAYDKETGLATLPLVERAGYVFTGWYLNGEKVESIPAGTTGALTLVASWKEEALYVGTENGQYATIAEALAAAQEGDKIIILAGTYEENLTITVPNLTIAGPNASINPNTGTREAEAILKGTITINTTAHNLKLEGLAFTGSAAVKGTQVFGFVFKNNYVYDTTESKNSWTEANTYPYGFVYFAATAAAPSKNLQFYNNKFENVSEGNITIASVWNASFDGNVFHNFDRDAIRFNGGANDGVLSFTNNEFVQDKLGGYNGIYFRIYGTNGTSDLGTIVVISNNKFVKIGTANAPTTGLYSGAISARNYNEYGASFSITNNYFEGCYNYIRIRNNAVAAQHAKYPWSCTVENNQFIGLPTDYYFAVWNTSDKDTTQNPILAKFGANYYEDNKGTVITDLAAYEAYFKQVADKGTALSSKPGQTDSTPVEYYTIQYDLDGGTVEDGTFVTSYNEFNIGAIAIPEPSKPNHQFLGWNLNGNLVTEIPANTKGDLVLVAEYAVLEGEVYSITFVDKDNLGTWPTRDAKNKDEILSLLWADMYEWAKGNGETGSYDEWFAKTSATIDAQGDLKLRDPQIGPYVSADGNTEYFLNSPAYYNKWVEFFVLYDKAQLSVNGTQPFFKTDTVSADTHASNVRFSEFVKGTRAGLDSRLADMLKAVRVEEERLTSYRAGQIIELPVLTNELGLEFYGWYDNPEFTGEPIKSILTTDSGDKTYYASWEPETVATKVELNVIEKLLRYETYQLIWSFTPEDTTYKDVEFFSSDPSIATVGVNSGLITALKNGEVTITMRVYSNRELDVVFNLTIYSPDHLVGTYETESLVVKNETIKLNATNAYLPNAAITWSSSNPDVAYVDATSGVVTGVKAGLATITATSVDSENKPLTLDFVVTVVDEALTGVLDFVASQNEANVFTRYDLLINGNFPFQEDIIGSVNRVLFNDKLNIDRSYTAAGDATGNHYGVKDSTEFITVHYTANNSTSAGALTHAKYFTNAANGVTIHYTTGNDGVYQALSDNLAAWHAGDSGALSVSGAFKWNPTGVSYDGTPLLEVEFTASDDFYFEINGKKTTVPLPTTWNYRSKTSDPYRNTDHIYNADGTITSQSDYTGTKFSNRTPESFFNSQDFPITVINGEYYMGTTWWSYGQVHEGRICGSGGNRNSIGIESAVNAGSDLWYTWQKTAQLVAQLMDENDLDISRVKGHQFFDGKDCPQPMLENDLEIWWEFIDLVQAEYELLTKYAGYEITCVSNNPEFVDNNGRVIKQPQIATCVTYTLTIKDTSGNTQTITLASMLEGVYQR